MDGSQTSKLVRVFSLESFLLYNVCVRVCWYFIMLWKSILDSHFIVFAVCDKLFDIPYVYISRKYWYRNYIIGLQLGSPVADLAVHDQHYNNNNILMHKNFSLATVKVMYKTPNPPPKGIFLCSGKNIVWAQTHYSL